MVTELMSTEIKANSIAYDDITAVLGPSSYEVPDGIHPVPHINVVQDEELGKKVFAFTLHVSPDDDRGINTDRQRTEIKVWGKSPSWMMGLEGS
jgi:hypothetical protein